MVHHFSKLLNQVIQSLITQFSVLFDCVELRYFISTCKIHLSFRQIDFQLTERWVMSYFEWMTILSAPPSQLAFLQLFRVLCAFSVHSRLCFARFTSSRFCAPLVQFSSIFTDARCLHQLRFFLEQLFGSQCHLGCLSVMS